MSLKWWEKTVEYFFIRKCIGESMVVAPLDGNEERAGDLIFSQCNKWILIEFKKDFSCLKKEKDKFVDFEEAKNKLENKDSHHFLVYGALFSKGENNESREFGVLATTYFSGKYQNLAKEMLESGLVGEEFIEYIKEFTSFKKNNGKSGGGLGFESYSLVAGINSENKVVACLSLEELGLELGLDLTPEVTPNIQITSPSKSSGMSGPGGR